MYLLMIEKVFLMLLKVKYFQQKNEGTGILNFDRSKILIPKQMPQRFLIALAQVKAGNNSENLLNGIWQIVYSLYQSKKRTLKNYTVT